MSTINFTVGRDTLDGVNLVHGSVHWHFIRKRFSDNVLVLSRSVSESLVPGGNPIEIPVTALGEAVSITVVVDGQSTTGLYKIPFGEIEYKNLVEVDRESLEPTAEPEPEWWAVAKSTVIGGSVDANGDLMLTRSDGVIINAGHVVGAKGDKGDQGERGEQGIQGEQGVQGEQGIPGQRGLPGTDGANGQDGSDGLDGAVLSGSDYSYTVSEVAGRTISLWDYVNQRQQFIYGDTGRRNITALFDGSAPNAVVGIAGGSVYLTRVGRMVELSLENVTLPPGQSPSFVNLGDIIPAGFQPPNERDYPLGARLSAEGASGGGLRVNRGSTGRVYIYLHADGEVIRVTANWFTEDPWPTTLPGVAV